MTSALSWKVLASLSQSCVITSSMASDSNAARTTIRISKVRRGRPMCQSVDIMAGSLGGLRIMVSVSGVSYITVLLYYSSRSLKRGIIE